MTVAELPYPPITSAIPAIASPTSTTHHYPPTTTHPPQYLSRLDPDLPDMENQNRWEVFKPEFRHVSRDLNCVFYHVPPRFLHPNPYKLEGHETVCVVRHPAMRLLSEFNMKKMLADWGPTQVRWDQISAASHPYPPLNRHSTTTQEAQLTTYLDTVLKLIKEGNPGPQCHYLPQYLYVWGAANEVTRVGGLYSPWPPLPSRP